ncbi:MAG: hypothetical protein IKT68_02860 [Clostridia bacterium]|nr:hypothetical protein [Clostridia bacterium]
MFCSKCGFQFDDSLTACPNCGAAVDGAPAVQQEAYPAQDTFVPAKSGNKSKLFLLIGGIAALALVLVLVFVLFGGGAESTAEGYLSARADHFDMIDAATYTTVDVDFDEIYEAAEPLDPDDFDGDSNRSKAMRKAMKEADSTKLEDVFPLYLEYYFEEEMNEDGYEREITDIEVGSVEEITVSNEEFENHLKQYTKSLDELKKSEEYKPLRKVFDQCEVKAGDIDKVQKVYVLYNIDTEEEGEDDAESTSYYVIKHDGSWKVLTLEPLAPILEVFE